MGFRPEIFREEAITAPVLSPPVVPIVSVAAPGSKVVSPQKPVSGMAIPSQTTGIVLQYIEDEFNYWATAVLRYVTSANPPLYVIEGFVRRIWKEQVIDKIGMVNWAVFLVRFSSKENQEKACNMNGILFNKKPFIVKPWFPKISYDKASLSTVPVWVKLPKLDVVYWTEGALKSIAGTLVRCLKWIMRYLQNPG